MIKQVIIFLCFILLEPVKRVISIIFYRMAYDRISKLRGDEILWKDFLWKYTSKRPTVYWFLLNDSEKMKYGTEYANDKKYYPSWAWSNGEFVRSWYFNAIRNSCCNFNNWIAYKVGFFKDEIKSGGKKTFTDVKNSKFGYRWELRQYDNCQRLYLEFNLFYKWQQFGWLRGNREKNGASRFEIDILKDKRTKK